jgi:hypothetical protein
MGKGGRPQPLHGDGLPPANGPVVVTPGAAELRAEGHDPRRLLFEAALTWQGKAIDCFRDLPDHERIAAIYRLVATVLRDLPPPRLTEDDKQLIRAHYEAALIANGGNPYGAMKQTRLRHPEVRSETTLRKIVRPRRPRRRNIHHLDR